MAKNGSNFEIGTDSIIIDGNELENISKQKPRIARKPLLNIDVRSDISSYLNKTLPDIQIDTVFEDMLGNNLGISETEREIRHEIDKHILIQESIQNDVASITKPKESIAKDNVTGTQPIITDLSASSLKSKPGATINKYWQNVFRNQISTASTVASYRSVPTTDDSQSKMSPNMIDKDFDDQTAQGIVLPKFGRSAIQPYIPSSTGSPIRSIYQFDSSLNSATPKAKKSKDTINSDNIVVIEERDDLNYSSSEASTDTRKPILFHSGIEFELGNLSDLESVPVPTIQQDATIISNPSCLVGPRDLPLDWSLQQDCPKTSTTTQEFKNSLKENTITEKFKRVFKTINHNRPPLNTINGRDLDVTMRVVNGPRELNQ